MTDEEIFQLVKKTGGVWVPRRDFAPHLEMTEEQLLRFVQLITEREPKTSIGALLSD